MGGWYLLLVGIELQQLCQPCHVVAERRVDRLWYRAGVLATSHAVQPVAHLWQVLQRLQLLRRCLEVLLVESHRWRTGAQVIKWSVFLERTTPTRFQFTAV